MASETAFQGSYFQHNGFTYSTSALALVSFLAAYFLGNAVYSITFHPLAKFPGPKIAAVSRIPWWTAAVTGEQVTWLLKLHARYGPVVRFAPNDVSYADVRAWKEVNGRKENGKAKEIIPPPLNGVEPIIIADYEQHTRVRRLFSPAFSDRALKQQEPLFRRHSDVLVSKLRGAAVAGEPIDMVKMFNCTTFDIMSELCFGKPLGLLENNEYTPWVLAVFDSVKIIPLVQIIEYYPLLKAVLNLLEPKSLTEMKTNHFKHSVDLVDQRLANGSKQPDIWNLVLSAESTGKGLTLEEMHVNADFFMVAGSETSATTLSGLCYFLLANPDKMKLMVNEIRGAFASSSDINMDRLAGLTYLNACLRETLRMYPPVPNGVARVVPAGGETILGQWVPPNVRVSVHHSATYRSPTNFRNPNRYAPERWVSPDEDTAGSEYRNDKREALQPFSVGPRNCLGQNMAWHQMRLLAAKLFLDFDLEICPESLNWVDQKVYSLWEKGPLMCRVKAVARDGLPK